MSHSQLFCHTSKSCVVNFVFFAWNPFNLPRVVGWYHWNPQNRSRIGSHMTTTEAPDWSKFFIADLAYMSNSKTILPFLGAILGVPMVPTNYPG